MAMCSLSRGYCWELHWPSRETNLELNFVVPPPVHHSHQAKCDIGAGGGGRGKPDSLHRCVFRHDNTVRPHSLTSLTSSRMTDLEKSIPSLPPKRYGKIVRNLRWSIFSVYRRLNILVLLPNVITMIVLGARHNLLRLPPSSVATAVAANLTLSVLVRQELVINILFAICGKCPRSLPLRFRRLVAKIYHLGGVHSGAGTAALVWFLLFNATLSPGRTDLFRVPGMAFITVSLDFLLVSIVILAHPTIRSHHHNLFEMVHRFAGWSTIILFWALLFVSCDVMRQELDPRPSLSAMIAKNPIFYLLIITTISVLLPWLRLRKVAVHAESLSDHAIRLHFTWTDLPLCAAPRISDNPLKEWHAFAGIPEESGHGFSLIVSKAGDWTSRIVKSPPTSIWVRGIPARGVLHIAPIFNRLILVATGSGIGPILSLVNARRLNCRILWSAPDPETTYKKALVEHVWLADPEAVIINTRGSPRPDLVQEAYNLYRQYNAEAIFIISNPKVTYKTVYGLEARGVPTFAPIFDS